MADERAQQIAQSLRDKDIIVETDLLSRSLKAQMKYASKINAEYVLILGDSEIEKGACSIRNMKDATQDDIEISKIQEYIIKIKKVDYGFFKWKEKNVNVW